MNKAGSYWLMSVKVIGEVASFAVFGFTIEIYMDSPSRAGS